MSEPLTVVLWYWRGRTHHTPFDHAHVNAAAHMVSANLEMPHRIVCITSEPAGIRCETRDISDISRKAAKKVGRNVGQVKDYRRLWLFSREAAEEFPGRVLNLDLDIVITRKLDPLLAGGEDFAIARGIRCPYNASLFVCRTGTRAHIWTQASAGAIRAARAHKWVGREQSWFAHIAPGAVTWGSRAGVYHRREDDERTGCRVMICAGRDWKPWQAKFVAAYPDLAAIYAEHYRKGNE